MSIYKSNIAWNSQRPGTLVVACSDGRLQENLDEFLGIHLNVVHYDRLYIPGGAGGLASSGMQFSRAELYRQECSYLITEHSIKQLILLFHGPASDGPPEACCVDYKRKLFSHSVEKIRAEQERDAASILSTGFDHEIKVGILVFRCEVGKDNNIQYVLLGRKD